MSETKKNKKGAAGGTMSEKDKEAALENIMEELEQEAEERAEEAEEKAEEKEPDTEEPKEGQAEPDSGDGGSEKETEKKAAEGKKKLFSKKDSYSSRGNKDTESRSLKLSLIILFDRGKAASYMEKSVSDSKSREAESHTQNSKKHS